MRRCYPTNSQDDAYSEGHRDGESGHRSMFRSSYPSYGSADEAYNDGYADGERERREEERRREEREQEYELEMREHEHREREYAAQAEAEAAAQAEMEAYYSDQEPPFDDSDAPACDQEGDPTDDH